MPSRKNDGVCGLTVAPHYLNIKTEDLACAARALGSAKPGAKNGAPGPASHNSLCLCACLVPVSRSVASSPRSGGLWPLNTKGGSIKRNSVC